MPRPASSSGPRRAPRLPSRHLPVRQGVVLCGVQVEHGCAWIRDQIRQADGAFVIRVREAQRGGPRRPATRSCHRTARHRRPLINCTTRQQPSSLGNASRCLPAFSSRADFAIGSDDAVRRVPLCHINRDGGPPPWACAAVRTGCPAPPLRPSTTGRMIAVLSIYNRV